MIYMYLSPNLNETFKECEIVYFLATGHESLLNVRDRLVAPI